MFFDAIESRVVLRERNIAELEPGRVDIALRCTDDHKGQAEELLAGLAGWWVEPPVERDPHGKAAFSRDIAAQLRQERIGTEVFEDRETLPCG